MNEPHEPGSLPEQDGNSAPGLRGVPFRVGHDPRRGHGPAKGAPNAGRPSNAALLREVGVAEEHVARMVGLSLTRVPEQILAALDDPVFERRLREHPFLWASVQRLRFECWREVTSRAHGRAGDVAERADADADEIVELTIVPHSLPPHSRLGRVDAVEPGEGGDLPPVDDLDADDDVADEGAGGADA